MLQPKFFESYRTYKLGGFWSFLIFHVIEKYFGIVSRYVYLKNKGNFPNSTYNRDCIRVLIPSGGEGAISNRLPHSVFLSEPPNSRAPQTPLSGSL